MDNDIAINQNGQTGEQNYEATETDQSARAPLYTPVKEGIEQALTENQYLAQNTAITDALSNTTPTSTYTGRGYNPSKNDIESWVINGNLYMSLKSIQGDSPELYNQLMETRTMSGIYDISTVRLRGMMANGNMTQGELAAIRSQISIPKVLTYASDDYDIAIDESSVPDRYDEFRGNARERSRAKRINEQTVKFKDGNIWALQREVASDKKSFQGFTQGKYGLEPNTVGVLDELVDIAHELKIASNPEDKAKLSEKAGQLLRDLDPPVGSKAKERIRERTRELGREGRKTGANRRAARDEEKLEETYRVSELTINAVRASQGTTTPSRYEDGVVTVRGEDGLPVQRKVSDILAEEALEHNRARGEDLSEDQKQPAPSSGARQATDKAIELTGRLADIRSSRYPHKLSAIADYHNEIGELDPKMLREIKAHLRSLPGGGSKVERALLRYLNSPQKWVANSFKKQEVKADQMSKDGNGDPSEILEQISIAQSKLSAKQSEALADYKNGKRDRAVDSVVSSDRRTQSPERTRSETGFRTDMNRLEIYHGIQKVVYNEALMSRSGRSDSQTIEQNKLMKDMYTSVKSMSESERVDMIRKVGAAIGNKRNSDPFTKRYLEKMARLIQDPDGEMVRHLCNIEFSAVKEVSSNPYDPERARFDDLRLNALAGLSVKDLQSIHGKAEDTVKLNANKLPANYAKQLHYMAEFVESTAEFSIRQSDIEQYG